MSAYETFIDSSNNVGIKCAVCSTLHWVVISPNNCSNCKTLIKDKVLDNEKSKHIGEDLEDCKHSMHQSFRRKKLKSRKDKKKQNVIL